ncbi:hypothetical protein FQN50_003849 [Emmonsiellopsis sp. PD_5]|nr:hypothetical protein FQN50_003849 [Emmonsiellopsis sp. PD_5]
MGSRRDLVCIPNRCAACLRAQRLRSLPALEPRVIQRGFTATARAVAQDGQKEKGNEDEKRNGAAESEQGAMSRRLSEMAEESMTEGGKSARKNMQEAGFSDELKKRLEERIATAGGSFKNEHAAAFSVANMPASAGRGTQDIAIAAPWTGNESIHDASLRMLNDASKPMRVPFKPPQPSPKNLQPTPKPRKSSGERLESARHRTSTYALSQNPNMSEKEREALRRELQERFLPSARAITPHGLSSLANERIEDAIARGQFRNIQRGKGVNVERDHNASSPYIDTTEYLMNKLIQKQEITPPWIEKQQELAKEVDRFRKRLRSDWRRHAARLIASQGGNLETQILRARAYAVAEEKLGSAVNGNNNNQTAESADSTVEYRTQIDHEGRLTRAPPSSSNPSPEQSHTASPDSSQTTSTSTSTPTPTPAATETETETETPQPATTTTTSPPPPPLPSLPPLRDPDYLKIEQPYHTLSIKNLNALTRSYNLMAPPVAQKPYLKLDRELLSCYAEVASSLPAEIKRRATERAHESSHKHVARGGGDGGFLTRLAPRQDVRLHEEDPAKRYGFREFWRDIWGRKDGTAAS